MSGTTKFVRLRRQHQIYANLLAVALTAMLAVNAWAKETPINGIALFDSPSGPAYALVSGILINGKTELRACSDNSALDKSSYKNLPKVALASVASLERMADGTLVAAVGTSPPTCVVPGNFKFEGNAALSPATLAEKSSYQGRVLSSDPAGTTALPAFPVGMKLVIVTEPDKPQAEFLRAERSKSIDVWRRYLAQYPSGSTLPQAQQQLADLLVKDGETKIAAYSASSSGAEPDFPDLSLAKQRADEALALVPASPSAAKLNSAVQASLDALIATANGRLAAYQQALKDNKPGYKELLGAEKLSQSVTNIDGQYPPGVALMNSVATERRAFEQANQTAAVMLSSKRYDDAYAAISKYRSFSEDDPRIKQVVAAAYRYHFDLGAAAAKDGKLQDAIAEFQKAAAIAQTPSQTAEVAASLTAAQASLTTEQNKSAADKALAQSQDDVAQKDFIGAYEVLADLSKAQQALVADQMTALQSSYVQAATDRATQLKQTHIPIHGPADEDAVRQAYGYLLRASDLSDDPNVKLLLDLVSDTISTYYVEQARIYFAKPLASGVGIGWAYLEEAKQYRPNGDAARDLATLNSAAYQMRSKLSISVLFRDQTSRRDSAGFADQLQDAIATGLETSGQPVRVIRPSSNTNGLEANFQFVGEILDHRTIKTVTPETLQSKYRSGEREMPNDAWNKADQQYEDELVALQKAQSELTVAQTKNKKKQVDEASAAVNAVEKDVQQARAKLNATPKTLQEDVIRPYSYTRITETLTNSLELSFRIIDSDGNPLEKPTTIVRNKPQKFVILQNIKPDDTEGVKEMDAPPDETQLMTGVEIEVRDSMVQSAREKVKQLPTKILAQARSHAANQDADGAAELYILYLNSTAKGQTPERLEAANFLKERFNIRNGLNFNASGS